MWKGLKQEYSKKATFSILLYTYEGAYQVSLTKLIPQSLTSGINYTESSYARSIVENAKISPCGPIHFSKKINTTDIPY